MVCASEGNNPDLKQTSTFNHMADLTFFQETTINDFDFFRADGYVTPNGQARWTAVNFDKGNALAFRISNIDISEEDGLSHQDVSDFLSESDNIYGVGAGENFLMGHEMGDLIEGGGINDFIHGNHGPDRLYGWAGDDEIRGGHGHDILDGGSGADYLWGGIGKNTVNAGNDFDRDRIFVPVDSVVNVNPDGVNCDILHNVWHEDEIYLHGVDQSGLTFQAGVLDPAGTLNFGVGIYANGVLEAIVTNGALDVAQVESMTTGGFFA